jgi:hypothetical protein
VTEGLPSPGAQAILRTVARHMRATAPPGRPWSEGHNEFRPVFDDPDRPVLVCFCGERLPVEEA